MKTKIKALLSAIIFLSLCHSSLFSGIISGTLVSTPNGFVPVQRLHAGNTVIGYCCKCKKLIKSPITKIKRKKGKQLVLIKIKNENLLVSKEQIFFDPSKIKWVRARNLTCKNYLMSYNFIDDNVVLSKVRCSSVQKVKRRSAIYEISLEYPHTLFISESQILTHNFACSLGLGLAFGSGMISLETIAVTASFCCLGLYTLFGRKSKFKTHVIYNPCNQNHSPNKEPDDEDDNDNKEKQEFEITKDAAQHIFRNKKNHLSCDAPENRKILFDLVSDMKNFLVEDMHGNKWYGKTLSDGKQLWATVRGNLITNGGINEIPRAANSKTGLSNLFPPTWK